MADVTYKIIIEGSSGGADGSGDSSSPRTTAITPKGEDVSPKSIYDTYKVIRNSAPVALALKYAHTAITTQINRVELRTGRAVYQERLNFAYNTALKGTAMVGATVAGLATGNYLLALGGAVSFVDAAVNYSIARETINLERRVENIGIGMANVRAGAGGDRNNRATY